MKAKHKITDKRSILFIFLMLCLFHNCVSAQSRKFARRYIEHQLDQDAPPNTGPRPDYSKDIFWAAAPFKHSTTDSIPTFIHEVQRSKDVDVFFLYPTSYKSEDENMYDLNDLTEHPMKMIQAMKQSPWNADVTDATINAETDNRSLLYQASVFNGSCRIFSPRYRQANLKAFFVRQSQHAQAAFDTAYSDIKNAFEYYLQHYNNGRPIIIASHSQGSLHAIRLLQDYFDGKVLQNKLVCAYIIGYQIPKQSFQKIPICNNPNATGCFVGWRSYQGSTLPKSILAEGDNSQCVNPLTWTTTTEIASPELNKGTVFSLNEEYVGKVGAQIDDKTHILQINLPSYLSDKTGKLKNLHVLDYNLFWMNIRKNVSDRIGAFYKQ